MSSLSIHYSIQETNGFWRIKFTEITGDMKSSYQITDVNETLRGIFKMSNEEYVSMMKAGGAIELNKGDYVFLTKEAGEEVICAFLVNFRLKEAL